MQIKSLLAAACAACALLLCCGHMALAQMVSPQAEFRSVRERVAYEVSADGSYVAIVEEVYSPLTTSGIEQASRVFLPYLESMAEVEVLEAYTLKQDGRRLDVAKDRIVTQSPPALVNAPMFSDMKIRTLIFPDLEIGDQVVYRAKFSFAKPLFPGHFSVAHAYPRSRLYDDVRLSVKYPKTLMLSFDARGLSEVSNSEEGGVVTRAWQYRNEHAIPEESNAVDPFDRDPQLIASSFKDWAALAAAYQARAEDKSAVTAEVRRLADEITKGMTSPREQVEAIYRWVSRNVRYVAVYLGPGGYVPHEADSVIKNRYGDCKDYVALLEALLAAKGIASSPVLIALGPRFNLPQVATNWAFNHVITWVPSLELYLDSSAMVLPFGVLADTAADKPVVHTRGFDGIRRTPALNADTNMVTTSTALTVGDDGSASGETSVVATGAVSAVLRTIAMRIDNPQFKAQAIREELNREGLVGTAEVSKDDPLRLAPSYTARIDFKLDSWLSVPGPGTTRLPSGLFSIAPIKGEVQVLNAPAEKVNHLCRAVSLQEEMTVRLPASIKPQTVPPSIDFSNSVASYRSSYSLDGRSIRAARKLVVRWPRASCTPQDMAAFREVAEKLRRDVGAQFSYR